MEELKSTLVFLPDDLPPLIFELAEEQGYQVIGLAPKEK